MIKKRGNLRVNNINNNINILNSNYSLLHSSSCSFPKHSGSFKHKLSVNLLNSLNLRQNVKPNFDLDKNMFKLIKNSLNYFNGIIQINKENINLKKNTTFKGKLKNYSKLDKKPLFKAIFKDKTKRLINKKPVFYYMKKQTNKIYNIKKGDKKIKNEIK